MIAHILHSLPLWYWLVFGACLILLAVRLWAAFAPFGYEDERGFHFGEPTDPCAADRIRQEEIESRRTAALRDVMAVNIFSALKGSPLRRMK